MSQPPYGQNPGGQPPYGQNPGGQPPYGQNPPQQPHGQGSTNQPYGQGSQPSGQPYGQSPQQPSGQPYGQSPQQPSGQYGQAPQQPSGQPYGQQAYGTPPVKKGPNIGLLVGVGVLALALIGGLIYAFTRPKTPVTATTPTPTRATASASTKASTSRSASASASGSADGFTVSGTTLSGRTFTSTLPSGWKLSEDNGAKNSGEIIDSSNNVVTYYEKLGTAVAGTGAQAKCTSMVEATRVTPNDKVVPAPTFQWGGQAAYGVEITVRRDGEKRDEIFGFYCTDRPDGTAMIESISWPEQEATVRTAAQRVITGWKWK